MTRRKGERPVSQPLDTYHPHHPVARMIASGDRWFQAWMMQKATPIGRLSKMTGIPSGRLLTIDSGDRLSRAELDALACAWAVMFSDIVSQSIKVTHSSRHSDP